MILRTLKVLKKNQSPSHDTIQHYNFCKCRIVQRNGYEYMVNDHIPSVLATGHFRDYKLCRVEGEEEGGKTFAVQYIAHSLASFNTYQTNVHRNYKPIS